MPRSGMAQMIKRPCASVLARLARAAHDPDANRRAFRNKAPFAALLAAVPVKVILNDQTGLLGAAVYAARTLKLE